MTTPSTISAPPEFCEAFPLYPYGWTVPVGWPWPAPLIACGPARATATAGAAPCSGGSQGGNTGTTITLASATGDLSTASVGYGVVISANAGNQGANVGTSVQAARAIPSGSRAVPPAPPDGTYRSRGEGEAIATFTSKPRSRKAR